MASSASQYRLLQLRLNPSPRRNPRFYRLPPPHLSKFFSDVLSRFIDVEFGDFANTHLYSGEARNDRQRKFSSQSSAEVQAPEENARLFKDKKVQRFAEVVDVDNNLHMLDPVFTLQHPFEILESVYSVDGITPEYCMEQEAFLSIDETIEILWRLPVKLLLRFRCICKTWRSIIDDPIFINLHRNRSEDRLLIKRHGFYIDRTNMSVFHHQALDAPVDLVLPPVYSGFFEILGSCDGWLCVTREASEPMFLWNPAIRELKFLPPAESPSRLPPLLGVLGLPLLDVYGFGFYTKTSGYKLVRIRQFVHHLDKDTDEVIVYSSDTDSWNKTFVDLQCLVDTHAFTVLLNGAMHWMADGFGELKGHRFIVSFDMGDEEFKRMPLPKFDAVYGGFDVCLSTLGEDLALMFYQQNAAGGVQNISISQLDIWVMHVYGVEESWTKQLTLKPLPGPAKMRPVGFWNSKKIILANVDNEEVFIYDLYIQEIVTLGCLVFSDICLYKESLVSIGGA